MHAGMGCDGLGKLSGVGARDFFEDLAVPEEDEEGDGGNLVGLGNVRVLLGVDGNEEGGGGTGWGGLSSEGHENLVHLRARSCPWRMEVQRNEGRLRCLLDEGVELFNRSDVVNGSHFGILGTPDSVRSFGSGCTDGYRGIR